MAFGLFCTLLFFVTCASCSKEADLPPDPPVVVDPCANGCDTSKLQVVWQAPLTRDTIESLAFHPLVYGDKVLFHVKFYGPDNIFTLRDGKNGDRLWGWQDPYIKTGADFGQNGSHIAGNKLLASARDDFYCIDLDRGTTLWETHIQPHSGNPRSWPFGDHIYHDHSQYLFADSIHLVGAPIATGTWDTLLTLRKEDGFVPLIESLAGWAHPQTGDTILFFRHVKLRFADNNVNGLEKSDLVAFSTGQRKELWRREQASYLSSTHPLLVEDNRIYFLASEDILCFDALTGETLWEKRGFADVMTSSMVKVGDKLAVNAVEHLYIMDAATGKVLRDVPIGSNDSSNIAHHNGVLYFTSGYSLYAVDINTGQRLWREPSPNGSDKLPAGFQYAGVAINHELGLLYTSDAYFAMCIKLLR